MNRSDMLDKLREEVCTVTFTKVNGEKRVMDCTLNMKTIPKEHQPKSDGNLAEGVEATINVIKVYDVKAEGWRSFRVDSVTQFRCAKTP